MTITVIPAYVDNASGDAYFTTRYPSAAWASASSADKTAVLTTASDAIDRLNFAGEMASRTLKLTLSADFLTGATVLTLAGTGIVPDGSSFQLGGNTYPVISHTETGTNTTSIATSPLLADALTGAPLTFYQTRQFPRGTDTVVPQDILKAVCELAYALLDGADPEIEIESVNTISQGLGEARTSYDRSFAQPHIMAGIPSIRAWHLLLPYLRDPNELRMLRDSFRLGNPQSFV